MAPHLQLLILLLAFLSHEPKAIAYDPPFISQVAPITKHTNASTPLYSIQMMITSWVNSDISYKNLLIDIDAPFSWYDCSVDWNSLYTNTNCPTCPAPVSCQEYPCTDVRTSYSFESPSCLPETNTSTLPGWGDCTCPVNVANPINKTCGQALLSYDMFTFRGSDGKNPFPDLVRTYPNAACAPSSSFESFPANVSGVMAFSTSRYAFPAYLFQPFTKHLGLCLPSSLSDNGVVFIGSGPYYLLPNSDVDVRSLLTYTPLLKHRDSFGYFIGVKSIVVKGRSIDVSNSITKISTIEPYTILRTDIYKELVHMFSMATMGMFFRVRSVAPFGLCLRNRTLETNVRFRVPDIVLGLEDGKEWRVSLSNSLEKVTKDVACLAFVDGGATSEHGIVMGTFQMEDNFLLFDLENSSLGFSSSLLSNKTSCANFNFTIGSH